MSKHKKQTELPHVSDSEMKKGKKTAQEKADEYKVTVFLHRSVRHKDTLLVSLVDTLTQGVLVKQFNPT